MIHLLLTMTLFLAPNDPALNERSNAICPCHIGSEEIQASIDQMLNVALDETKSRSILVGLAAPQIGIPKRIILVDTAATGIYTEGALPPPAQIHVYINPEILWQSEETNQWREGCFSTSRVCGLVDRSNEIVVQAYDRTGNILVEKFTGYTARIFQHEIDHLNGTRFPDRVTDEAHLHWVELEELPQYRVNWATWDKKCPQEMWLQIKNPFK